MQSIHDAAETQAMQDEKNLLAYLEDMIIPCANCGENIDVDEAHRWINRLVCADCIAQYDGLSPDDETNYDDTAVETLEEQNACTDE